VWAFDRIVIPAGTTVDGQLTQVQPVSPMLRAMSIVRGDFTPLKRAQITFTRLTLPGGSSRNFDAQPSFGLDSIYMPPSKNKNPPTSNSKAGRLRRFVQQQAMNQANARAGGMLGIVRAPNRREWLEDFLWQKLPYHPQWYRSGTRFDAVLDQPLDFGDTQLSANALDSVGGQPSADSLANIRMLSSLSSKEAKRGDPVTATLSAPLFAPGHRVVLPEGTRLVGKVTMARSARMFHRGGQLRFAFEKADVPAQVKEATNRTQHLQAELTDVEPSQGNVKVDAEGTAKATESKTRFIRPIIAGLVAVKSLDNDEGKQSATGGASANYSGRGLGGFSGFGLLGIAAAKGPRPLGSALGFYGLGWSVYSTVVSRGKEVVFEKNSAMQIRFGAQGRAK
jgi:hypothetical protein